MRFTSLIIGTHSFLNIAFIKMVYNHLMDRKTPPSAFAWPYRGPILGQTPMILGTLQITEITLPWSWANRQQVYWSFAQDPKWADTIPRWYYRDWLKQLERDRWVWAINAEVERQARAHLDQQNLFRTYGKVIDRWWKTSSPCKDCGHGYDI